MRTELPDLKPGDNLTLTGRNRYQADGPVTVSRIGRKWLYVNLNGRELRERFDRKTGAEDTRYSGSCLYTPEQYEEKNTRNDLFNALMDSGIEFRHGVPSTLSTDKLRAILAIVQDDSTDRTTEK